MQKIILLTILVLSLSICHSQTTKDSVQTTINSMFLAMKTSDTSLLKICFTDSAILQTVAVKKDGSTKIKTETVKDFVAQMATIASGAADEQIQFGNINIDGALANVWTPYQFYFNGKFSHCGANNFIMVRTNNKWLIQYIIDTRRKNGCD